MKDINNLDLQCLILFQEVVTDSFKEMNGCCFLAQNSATTIEVSTAIFKSFLIFAT